MSLVDFEGPTILRLIAVLTMNEGRQGCWEHEVNIAELK